MKANFLLAIAVVLFILPLLKRMFPASLPGLLISSTHKTSAPSTLVSPPNPSLLYGYEINNGSRLHPNIALTFDADLTPAMLEELKSGKVNSWYNKKIIDVLEAYHVPATVFMSAMWAELYPDVTQSLSKNPLFEIANHSYSHPAFSSPCYKLPPPPSWGKQYEFSKSQSLLSHLTGITPVFFRFPGGCHTQKDTQMANANGLTVVGWDVASGDSFNNDRQSIINNVKTRTQNGSIILFHFHGGKNAPLTAEVLPEIIEYLQQQNFKFVTLTQLLSEK